MSPLFWNMDQFIWSILKAISFFFSFSFSLLCLSLLCLCLNYIPCTLLLPLNLKPYDFNSYLSRTSSFIDRVISFRTAEKRRVAGPSLDECQLWLEILCPTTYPNIFRYFSIHMLHYIHVFLELPSIMSTKYFFGIWTPCRMLFSSH